MAIWVIHPWWFSSGYVWLSILILPEWVIWLILFSEFCFAVVEPIVIFLPSSGENVSSFTQSCFYSRTVLLTSPPPPQLLGNFYFHHFINWIDVFLVRLSPEFQDIYLHLKVLKDHFLFEFLLFGGFVVYRVNLYFSGGEYMGSDLEFTGNKSGAKRREKILVIQRTTISNLSHLAVQREHFHTIQTTQREFNHQ